MSEQNPNRLDYATPQKPSGVGAAIGGCALGVIGTCCMGVVTALGVGGSAKAMGGLFAAVAIVALLGATHGFRAKGRMMLPGFLLGVGLTCIIEGLCFFQMR